ncbi:MAG TPA: alkaline phosphatase family protein [Candidatus Dormibacteraeota bacterium]
MSGAPFEGVLWLVWDGASFDVIRELLDEGELPALRSICQGQVLPLAPLTPNCQTPPSLASLFTGSTMFEHGVSGFRVPVLEPDATFADRRSGFDRSVIRRPTIWERVAESGVRVGLCHAAWATADALRERPAMAVVDAYERCLSAPGVVDLEPAPAERSVDLGGREMIVRVRDDGCDVSAPATAERVRLAPWPSLRFDPAPLRFGPGLATRLSLLAPADGRRLLVHSGLWEMRAHPRALQDALDAEVGAFAGKVLGDAYRAGAFGPRAVEGGDGLAEEVLLESAVHQADSFARTCELVLRASPGNGLVIAYLPTIDEVQHELFRWWCGSAGDGVMRRLREVVRRAYRLADGMLARLLAAVGPGCAVVVSSDHGAGVLRRKVHLNETLARVGLVRFDEQGWIDVRASRAAFHPAGNGSIWVNLTGRPGGLVGPESRRAVVEAAELALRGLRDPLTGRPPLDVTRVGEAERGSIGELFVRLRPGYECTAKPGPGGDELRETRKAGTHVTPTGESSLNGILAVGDGAGPVLLDRGLTLTDVYPVIDRLVVARQARTP